ncbi:MAG: hypothetical protein K8Q99_04300 [Acholeplasmataceae bacterium]|nr:hypothetical protein [Acholeplasmataceae bacterium]
MAKKKLNKTARKTRLLIKRDSMGKTSKGDKRKHKRNLKVGDVVVSTNYRLGMKVKSKKDNRMVVVTSTKKPKSVNPIVSVRDKNKGATNMIKITKKKNPFLKNDSTVLKKSVTKIKSTHSEKSKGRSNKRDVDLKDKSVFSSRIAKLNIKDKKRVLKHKKKSY